MIYELLVFHCYKGTLFRWSIVFFVVLPSLPGVTFSCFYVTDTTTCVTWAGLGCISTVVPVSRLLHCLLKTGGMQLFQKKSG